LASQPLIRRWNNRPSWARSDRSAWRSFALAIVSLAAALLLALYSSAVAESGQMWLAASSAFLSLVVAGWVAVTIVPVLARRTQLRWLAVRIDYHFTREGVVCLCAILVVALAALNTGNNLLFIILASLLAAIVVSGVVSQAVLSGVAARLELPEHIFAGRPVMALAELVNQKQTLPSFSLRLVSLQRRKRDKKDGGAGAILPRPVYFAHLPRRHTSRQNVELCFPHRGIYRQDALGLQTKFPFGFLEKTRAIDSGAQALVYPSVEPTNEFHEILPLVSGELESFLRGRGHDLYSIRDYQNTDSARHVDWKASAKTGRLQVREFAREDERRVLLVLDPSPSVPAPAAPGAMKSPGITITRSPAAPQRAEVGDADFERGITLCASLAWHFHEIDSALAFRTAGFETPMAPAGEIIYDILGHLATLAPQPATDRSFLHQLADSPQIFKIILTGQPRGSIPASLWSSSYILFLDAKHRD
jgi:uncharacterized protein (DUF58 family)